jgi:hypothetical protein
VSSRRGLHGSEKRRFADFAAAKRGGLKCSSGFSDSLSGLDFSHLIHTGSLTTYPLKERRSQGAYTPCHLIFDEAPSSALKKGLLSLRLLAGFPGLETYLLLAACPVLLLVRARGGSLSL